MPIETFNTSLESTQNKQQYGTKITGTELGRGEKREKVILSLNLIKKMDFWGAWLI